MTTEEEEVAKFRAIKTWAEYSEYMREKPATELVFRTGSLTGKRVIWFPSLQDFDEKKKELTRTNGPREYGPAASDP